MLLFLMFKEITLDLKGLKFSSKSYQRIKESFERFQTKFDMIICWESNSKQLLTKLNILYKHIILSKYIFRC